MLFADFAAYLDKLEKLSSRNEMTALLAELFSKFAPEDIEKAMYLLSGRVAPGFLAVEFSFSTKLLLKALVSFSKQTEAQALSDYQALGDIGAYTEQVFSKYAKVSKPQLSLVKVFGELEKIALTNGKNAQSEKQRIYLALLAEATAVEAKYFSRILVGNMRLGLSTKTIFDALSWTLTGDKSLRDKIESAYGVSVDLGLIAKITLIEGVDALSRIQATPGTPVASKLVEREKTAEAIIERLGDCYIQPKFDGLRVQIHYNKAGFGATKKLPGQTLGMFSSEEPLEKVRIFSRNLEDLTPMLPDVVAAVQTLPIESVILDGEAIGFDANADAFLPFQETIKRKRKYDVDQTSSDVPLQINLFDVLALNGRDLLSERIEVRSKILEDIFGKDAYNKPLGIFKLAETTLVKTPQELDELFTKYVGQNLEGIIAKDDATFYKPGTRNFDWIKLKASAKTDLVDTIDAVVLGYYFGTGARAKFGIGAILIGVFDPDNDRYVSLTKVGTGFKDADWPIIKGTLDPIKVATLPKNYVINKTLVPDVLVAPQVVVVVEADSISISKIHGDKGGSGLSLRFPRIKLFNRDKSPQDATTIGELQRMYILQQEGN